MGEVPPLRKREEAELPWLPDDIVSSEMACALSGEPVLWLCVWSGRVHEKVLQPFYNQWGINPCRHNSQACPEKKISFERFRPL